MCLIDRDVDTGYWDFVFGKTCEIIGKDASTVVEKGALY